jgi:flagellin
MEAKVADQTQINLGQLVDTDLAKEAARLEAAKVKQSLIVQALSIANNLPAIVLSLFQPGSSRR